MKRKKIKILLLLLIFVLIISLTSGCFKKEEKDDELITKNYDGTDQGPWQHWLFELVE